VLINNQSLINLILCVINDKLFRRYFKSMNSGKLVFYLVLCICIELLIFFMHYYLLIETFDTINLEINLQLEDDQVFGKLFTKFPDITAQNLLGIVCGMFFIFLPIYIWYQLIYHDFQFSSIKKSLKYPLILFIFFQITIWTAEFIMIWHRINLGSNNAFITSSGQETKLSVFFSFLFIIVNISVSYATSMMYLKYTEGKSKNDTEKPKKKNRVDLSRTYSVFICLILFHYLFSTQSIYAFSLTNKNIENSIQVILDNSGTNYYINNTPETIKYTELLLFNLTNLRKDKDKKKSMIHIVTLNSPKNIFVGTPKDLMRYGNEVKSYIKPIKEGCSDLFSALQQVQTNIKNLNPKKSELIIFSPLIITGDPCNNVSINLPQKTPNNIDLSFFKENSTKLFFYWVHYKQYPEWSSFLEKNYSEDYLIYDIPTTKNIFRPKN